MKFFRHIFVLCMTVNLGACANFSTGNLFSDYATQNNELHQALAQGDYKQAAKTLPDPKRRDILGHLEKGRVYMLNHELQQSQSALEKGVQAVQQQQELATISVSREVTNAGSLMTNDNLNDYVPADYELGYLHLYLALTYVYKNQLEDALVELRLANQVQEKAKKSREKELENEQSELKKQGVQPNIGSILAHCPDAGEGLKSVQNGYLFYLSALLYETSGDLNDAYVDYRRALAVAPDNLGVIHGTLRCAQKLGMHDDLVLLRQRYGKVPVLPDHHGRVLLLQEQGVVDPMKGWQLSLPIFDSQTSLGNIYSLALPYYQAYHSQKVLPVRLDDHVVNGDLLSDTNLMARTNLRERMTTMVIRQLLRLVVKNSIREGVSKNNKDIVNLVINVWNMATEQPDTRSWLTLPASVFSSTVVVPAGPQTLVVGEQTYKFDVPEHGTTLVWFSRQGDNAVIWHKQLGKL
ncbi:hypothetical protein P4S72_20990 [Vibrio sp. PP-XX7]